jgi:hypothetical protein
MEPTEENVTVGCYVVLRSDASDFQRSFDNCGYRWDESMRSILGKEVCVVDRPRPGIFGLPECLQNSGQPIWWYPMTVIDHVKTISNPCKVYETMNEFLSSVGLENDTRLKAIEILERECVTVKQLESVIDDADLLDIGIEQVVIEAIGLHRQRLANADQ